MLLLTLVIPVRTEARIVKITIERRESPAFGGRSFEGAGQYEKIIGRATGELDPNDARNKIITDIQLAPRNARGMVEFETDFYIARPIDPRKANGLLFYHVANRGGKDDPVHFGVQGGNELSDPGEGLLYRRGYTFLWSGWQPDLIGGDGAMTIRVPVARNRDGSEITGRVRMEFITNMPAGSLHMYSRFGTNFAGYDAASLNNATATLTRRSREQDPRREIPRADWAFAECNMARFPGTPNPRELCLRGDFQPDQIYELVYTAKNPTVQGIGFAATRDVIAFFRAAQKDEAGTENPIAGLTRAVVMRGVSQSGRFMRSFLDLGFNQDEQGRQVSEGMHLHVASQRMPMNLRWAQPGRGGSLQHEEHASATSDAPFTWEAVADPLTGRTAGLLDNCRKTKTCPKIIQTISGTEYWQGAMSLNTTDGLGKKDVPVPDNVRIYYLASTQHGPDPQADVGICQQRGNPAPHRETLRALTVALEQWALSAKEPPASRYPKISDGTLVSPDAATLGWPAIPGVKYPGFANVISLLDFGPEYDARFSSGVLREPPVATGKKYVILVPKVDADGNDVAGVRSTAIRAPLGTHTGWNMRRTGYSESEMCGLQGSYIRLHATPEDREKVGDPRLSLEERYLSHSGYMAAVGAATEALRQEGFLLEEDVAKLTEAAQMNPGLPLVPLSKYTNRR